MVVVARSYGTFNSEATEIWANITNASRTFVQCSAASEQTQTSKFIVVFPNIQFVIGVTNGVVLVTYGYLTEVTFQTDERVTSTETS